MLDYLQGVLANSPPAAASLLLTLVAGGLLWVVQNRLTRFDDHQVLFRDGNVAYLLQRAALLLGFAVAALPTAPHHLRVQFFENWSYWADNRVRLQAQGARQIGRAHV